MIPHFTTDLQILEHKRKDRLQKRLKIQIFSVKENVRCPEYVKEFDLEKFLRNFILKWPFDHWDSVTEYDGPFFGPFFRAAFSARFSNQKWIKRRM